MPGPDLERPHPVSRSLLTCGGLKRNKLIQLKNLKEWLGPFAPLKRRNMAPANSGASRDEERAQNRAADELRQRQSRERISPVSEPISQVRRLDVDAVLKRSLRKVVSEELHSPSSETLHEVGDVSFGKPKRP